jgi:hypothetical protein
VLGTDVGAIPVATTIAGFAITSAGEGADTAVVFMIAVHILASHAIGLFRKGTRCYHQRRSAEFIRDKRAKGDFDLDSVHVTICGPIGSGESSLIDALRGLSNTNESTAETGIDETVENGGTNMYIHCIEY